LVERVPGLRNSENQTFLLIFLKIKKIRNSRTLEGWLAGWLTEGAFLRELVISLKNPLIERVPAVRKQENPRFLRIFLIFQIFLICYRLGKFGTPVLWRAGWLAD